MTDAQYRVLLVPIQTFLDQTDDPLERLRHVRQLQLELLELLSDEHRRARLQLQAAGRWGPRVLELSNMISLGTAQIGPKPGPKPTETLHDVMSRKK
jgi:hypothetical protein